MSEPVIQRASELFFCGKLRESIPDHLFLPYTGGDGVSPAEEVEPPFTVLYVQDAEKRFDQESTWFIRGGAYVVTHAGEVDSQEHSNLARSIYALLGNLNPVSTSTFAFHGISIERMRSADDDDQQAHVDVVEFVAGVGG